MGSIGTLFAATLVAVTYGWMPASSDNNGESASASKGYEYLVQVDAEDLRALAEGRVSSLSSATPEGMKSIDRVRIVFGESELPRQLTAVDRTSPKRLAKLSQTAVKHTVAKPIVSDWLPARSEATGQETGKRHTVYQQPGYQSPGSLGSEVVRRNEAMQQGFADALRNGSRNLGNYADQTARDLAQGTQGVVGGALGGLRNSAQAGARGLGNAANNAVNLGSQEYFNQRQQEQNRQSSQANGTGTGTGTGSYKPYNYDAQPTLAAQSNSQDNHAGHDHSGHDHAGHNHAPANTNLDRQPLDNRSQGRGGQGPALPSATGRPAADDGIATSFGSRANTDRQGNDQGYRRNESNQGYNAYQNDFRNNDRLKDDRRNETDRNYDYRDSYVDRRDDGRMTPVVRDSTRLAPLDEFASSRDNTSRDSSRNSNFDDWGRGAPTADTRRPTTAPAFGTPSSFDTPPLTPRQPVNQTAGFANQGQNQGNSSDVRSWGDTGTNNSTPQAGGQYNQQQNGVYSNNNAGNNGQQNASLPNPADNPWLMVFLLGSLAGNFYVATSYLDVRNKYRSALRRGPSGYQQGV